MEKNGKLFPNNIFSNEQKRKSGIIIRRLIIRCKQIVTCMCPLAGSAAFSALDPQAHVEFQTNPLVYKINYNDEMATQ